MTTHDAERGHDRLGYSAGAWDGPSCADFSPRRSSPAADIRVQGCYCCSAYNAASCGLCRPKSEGLRVGAAANCGVDDAQGCTGQARRGDSRDPTTDRGDALPAVAHCVYACACQFDSAVPK